MDLPDDDHVLRHVPRKKLFTDEDGNVLGLLPQAFELREGERGLSVNWIEYFKQSSKDENINQAKLAFEKHMTVRASSRYALGVVKNVIESCSSQGYEKVKIVHAESAKNPAHSSIIRLPHNDRVVMEALAADAFMVLEPVLEPED